MRSPTNAIELYRWFCEEMDSEGRDARAWATLDPGTQIAWGKLYRRLLRENPQRAATPGPRETNELSTIEAVEEQDPLISQLTRERDQANERAERAIEVSLRHQSENQTLQNERAATQVLIAGLQRDLEEADLVKQELLEALKEAPCKCKCDMHESDWGFRDEVCLYVKRGNTEEGLCIRALCKRCVAIAHARAETKEISIVGSNDDIRAAIDAARGAATPVRHEATERPV
jgi:hypothetical protein